MSEKIKIIKPPKSEMCPHTIVSFDSYNELDEIIQFWIYYWDKQGVKLPEGLDSLHIKVLIAIESSFNPSAKAKTSSATGLMQLLTTARRSLKGTSNTRKNEVRNHFVSVTMDELKDPVINIATGIRWLAHKYYLLRNHKNKSIKEVLRDYHSRDKAGEEYARKIQKI